MDMGKVLNKNAATETLEKLELYWNPQQARAVIKFWAQFQTCVKQLMCVCWRPHFNTVTLKMGALKDNPKSSAAKRTF